MACEVADLRAGSLVRISGREGLEDVGQLGKHDAIADEFQVTLLNGEKIFCGGQSVEGASELRRPGEGGGQSSFDVFIGDQTVESALTEELVGSLFEKGFCVLKTAQQHSHFEATMDQMRRLERDGVLARMPEETEEWWLGLGHRGKVVWMDSENGPHESALIEADDLLTTLGSLIQPSLEDAVGGYVVDRTPGLVSLSLAEAEEDLFPRAEADNRMLGEFLLIWRRQLLKARRLGRACLVQVSLQFWQSGCL